MRKTLYAALLMLCSTISAWADELPDRLFLQGPAAIYGGWNPYTSNKIEYQRNEFTNLGDGIFRYVGWLYNGDFKIIANETDDYGTWKAADAPSASGSITLTTDGAEHSIRIEPSDSTWDGKWFVSEGKYMLTVDANTMKIKCEAMPTLEQDGNGNYLINNSSDLLLFSELINHYGIDAKSNAKLNADINICGAKLGEWECEEVKPWHKSLTIGIHNDISYAGTFDGQGHKIAISLESKRECTALFSYLYEATIKNLWVGGEIKVTDGHQFAGGVCGRSRTGGPATTLENLHCTVHIYDNQSGNGTHGGLAAIMERKALVKNCVFRGSLDMPNRSGCGGLVGWCEKNDKYPDDYIEFENCLIIPEKIDWQENSNNDIVGRNHVKFTAEHFPCYYSDKLFLEEPKSFPTGLKNDHNAKYLEDADYITSGHFAWDLNGGISGNGVWGQRLWDNFDDVPISHISTFNVYKLGNDYNNWAAFPKLRCEYQWGEGRVMLEADGNTRANRHYHYKGLISTNRPEGIFINFLGEDGKTYIIPNPDETTLTSDGNVHIKTIESGVTYNVVGKQNGELDGGAETYGFVLPTGHEDMRPELLDIDMLLTDDGTAQLTITRLPAAERKLYVTGTLHNNNWKPNPSQDGSSPYYLEEVGDGSLLFRGWVRIVQPSEGEKQITLFAPRYDTDLWRERIGPNSEGTQGNIPTKDNWETGLRQHQDRSWTMPNEGWYFVSVDLAHHGFNNCLVMYEDAIEEVTVSNAGWATYAPSFNIKTVQKKASAIQGDEVDAPDNMKVYYITDRNDETLVLTTIETKDAGHVDQDKSIAMGTGLLIQAPEGSIVRFWKSFEETQALENNKLVGTTEPTSKPTDTDHAYYILGKYDGKVKFYRWGDGKLKANRSYLSLPASAGAPEFYNLFDEETAIDKVGESTSGQVNEIYTLSGQRIGRMQRGVNIVNGKKVLF